MALCPAPGCDRTIADSSSACLRHWRALPAELRRKIGRHQEGVADGTSCPANLEAQIAKAQRVWAGLPAVPGRPS